MKTRLMAAALTLLTSQRAPFGLHSLFPGLRLHLYRTPPPPLGLGSTVQKGGGEDYQNSEGGGGGGGGKTCSKL